MGGEALPDGTRPRQQVFRRRWVALKLLLAPPDSVAQVTRDGRRRRTFYGVVMKFKLFSSVIFTTSFAMQPAMAGVVGSPLFSFLRHPTHCQQFIARPPAARVGNAVYLKALADMIVSLRAQGASVDDAMQTVFHVCTQRQDQYK
jgi:hypothetical protein